MQEKNRNCRAKPNQADYNGARNTVRLPSAAYYFLSTSHIFLFRFFFSFCRGGGRENAIIKIIVFTMLYETVTNTFNSLLSKKNVFFFLSSSFFKLFIPFFSSNDIIFLLLVMLDSIDFFFGWFFENGGLFIYDRDL